MNKDEVQKLAALARIEIGEEEAESLSHEFDSILKYVIDVKNVDHAEASSLRREEVAPSNTMRDDTDPHEPGIYTEKILAEAPGSEKGYVKVKKIL